MTQTKDTSEKAARKRAIKKAHYQANHESINARHAAWRVANREEIRVKARAKYAENRDAECERNRARYAENLENEKARATAYYEAHRAEWYRKTLKWRKANIEKSRASTEKWNAAHPHKVSEARHRRRALLKGCTEHYTPDEIEALWAKAGKRCANCGRKRKLTIDHIMPLSSRETGIAGANSIRNIQFLCMPCNISKSDRDPITFARANGKLL